MLSPPIEVRHRLEETVWLPFLLYLHCPSFKIWLVRILLQLEKYYPEATVDSQ